ncbi:hypothetical protein [Leptospira stimsonii]|uniref:hypothetical protein n=1 Tax=Leptospira stimsonii TaxID=2202203 RepID=UPI000E59AEE3|nr:hypothetical protein [Leptospira stimsonii]
MKANFPFRRLNSHSEKEFRFSLGKKLFPTEGKRFIPFDRIFLVRLKNCLRDDWRGKQAGKELIYESRTREQKSKSQHSHGMARARGGRLATGTSLYAVEISFRRNPKKSLLRCKAGGGFFILRRFLS